MATANPNSIQLLNAGTKHKLDLIKQNAVIDVSGEIVICDLYRDPTSPAVAILVVQRKMHVDDIDDLLATPADKTPAIKP